jgi:hypothetical protein
MVPAARHLGAQLWSLPGEGASCILMLAKAIFCGNMQPFDAVQAL